MYFNYLYNDTDMNVREKHYLAIQKLRVILGYEHN